MVYCGTHVEQREWSRVRFGLAQLHGHGCLARAQLVLREFEGADELFRNVRVGLVVQRRVLIVNVVFQAQALCAEWRGFCAGVRQVTRVKERLTIECRAVTRLLRRVQEFLFNVEQHLFEFRLREHFQHLRTALDSSRGLQRTYIHERIEFCGANCAEIKVERHAQHFDEDGHVE